MAERALAKPSMPWGLASFEGRQLRLPKGGVVRPGEKVEGANGGEYSRELDCFNVEDAPAIKEVYGDCPKLIRGVFGSDNLRDNVDLGYKKWHQNQTIACRGDGRVAVDLDEGIEKDCLGEECPMVLEKKCRRQITIAFLPYEAPTIAVHTFTSSGWRTIENTLAFMELLQTIYGRLAGIRFAMIREPYKCTRTTPDGKKVNQVHHCIRFDLEKPLQEVVPIGVPAYERPAALDECSEPSLYPKAVLEAPPEAEPIALPPRQEVIPAEPDQVEAEGLGPVSSELLGQIRTGWTIVEVSPEEKQEIIERFRGQPEKLRDYLSALATIQDSAPAAPTPVPQVPRPAPRVDQRPIPQPAPKKSAGGGFW